MANHTQKESNVLGRDSDGWVLLVKIAFLGLFVAGFLGFLLPVPALDVLLALASGGFIFFTIGALILVMIREWKADKEREEVQKYLSSPNPPTKLTADPALYRRAQAELQARKEEALKMQQLHALRQQVEDEERKAGIFAPTLPPSSSNSSQKADPQTALMAQLAQRRIEAERQKHLMKSLRNVEDAEWEADDV